ncbi:uncharacterized protein LOC107478185 [Arachis duranensis]|uniref:Uncharacterized protein LOC107478185 n=1 Tax=Arachis duranensis TaxID=130453 RepID=A0A6P4CNL8_ARADU|nr:uncharacterized protein LOC107478185 [Arachis duranensis]
MDNNGKCGNVMCNPGNQMAPRGPSPRHERDRTSTQEPEINPNNLCVEFATYLLTREASNWWQGARRLLQQGNDPITWGAFQVEFYKKYFPNSPRTVKELELLLLKQGTMSVSEYTDKFEELFRFSHMCQGTPGDFEEWKCIKYEGGLRSEILSSVGPMEIRVFSELVNKSRIAEECVRKAVEAKNDRRESHRREHNQEYPTRGQEFKRRGYPQRFPQRRNDLATNKNSQGKGRKKQILAASDVLSCQRCGGHHRNRPCRYGSGLCYNCRKLGHLVRDCPHRKDWETARSDFRT